MPQVVAELINLVSVQVTNANVNLNTGKDLLKDKPFNINFETNTGVGTDQPELCRIEFTANFSPTEELKDQTDFSASFTIEFLFIIENLAEFLLENPKPENGPLIDGALGATLMGVVYSTARGIILTRTAGTLLDGIILPVMNPARLLAPTNQPKASE